MPRHKSKPGPKPKRSSFKRALKEAKNAHVEKVQERTAIMLRLQALNVEIPNLERTCRALEAQLNAKTEGKIHLTEEVNEISRSLALRSQDAKFGRPVGEPYPIGVVFSTDDIPPEVRAKLPPEDLAGMSSHFGDKPAPSEDFLPEIDGKEVIVEKGK